MSTTALSKTTTLDPRIGASLDGLRRRIWWYVWAHGVGTTVAWACAAFWLSLLVDWFFEPAVGVRALLLLAGVGLLGAVAINMVARRLRVRLTDANMAMLLERRFPGLDDALLTAVSLGPGLDRMKGPGREMLGRTCREASRRIGEARLGEVFDPAPLGRALAAAGLLAASIVLFGVLAPSSLGTWARRSLLLADELWPRRTGLSIEGFDGGVRKVARGGDLKIVATADLKKPLVPRTIEVRYRTEGGARGRAAMNREGEAARGRERFQEYSYTFREILSPIEFDLAGGDARLRGLRIEVVESPKIESIELGCEYPTYMGRSARRIPVIGPMRIPQGTRVVIEGRANKGLVDVRVSTSSEGASTEPVVVKPTDDVAGGRGFRHDLGPVEEDVTVFLTLSDIDGIESVEPARVVLAAVADEPPELSVTLAGIGTAITPRARLPAVGQVRDDFGIAEVWFEYAADQGKPARKPIAAPRGNLTELAVDDALEVREVGLVPGQKFHVGLKASDRCDRRPAPRAGESSRWQLEVVTPERLRAMLQARELTLRYRFEQIIQEVSETRDSLVRISFGGGEGEEASGEPEKKELSAGGEEPEDKTGDWAGREPGEQPEGSSSTSPSESRQRRLAARSLRCERAIQNSRKNANETLGTAEAFDDLRLQLINNRIDTEELKTRLKSGIADPLRVIGEEMFPELERRLLALRGALESEQAGPGKRDAAKEQLGAILTAMNRVLGRMMELEDFNQVITLLQGIIEAQEKLEKEIRERHKTVLRDLLEEK